MWASIDHLCRGGNRCVRAIAKRQRQELRKDLASEDDDHRWRLSILKLRLAKGEISLEDCRPRKEALME